MNLKDFIKNTVSSISEAIIESQLELSEKGVIVNPEKTEIGKTGEKLLRSNGWRYVQNLDFDILVAVDDKQGTGGKREFGNARATPYIFFKTLEQLEQETKEEAKTHYWTADSFPTTINVTSPLDTFEFDLIVEYSW